MLQLFAGVWGAAAGVLSFQGRCCRVPHHLLESSDPKDPYPGGALWRVSDRRMCRRRSPRRPLAGPPPPRGGWWPLTVPRSILFVSGRRVRRAFRSVGWGLEALPVKKNSECRLPTEPRRSISPERHSLSSAWLAGGAMRWRAPDTLCVIAAGPDFVESGRAAWVILGGLVW